MDIVCGRGESYDGFPGNQFFRNLIQGYANSYSSTETTRSEKSIVIRTISKQLKHRNVRFIKRNHEEGWAVLEEKEVYIKIGHALRDVDAVRRKETRNRKKKMAKKSHETHCNPTDLASESRLQESTNPSAASESILAESTVVASEIVLIPMGD